MFSCTNKIEASLPFSSINPKLLDTYHVLEIHSLSRWSDLDWILRLWPSVLLLQEKPVSVDSKNVLENIIFMEMSAVCPLAQWKIHHHIPGSTEHFPELELLPL